MSVEENDTEEREVDIVKSEKTKGIGCGNLNVGLAF